MEQSVNKKKKGKIIILAVVAIIILAFSFYYWQSSKGKITTDNAQLDCNIVNIKSCVSGYIDTIYFNDNEYVEKGQVLLVIDTSDLKLKVIQAEAALKIAEAKLSAAKEKASASSSNAEAGNLTEDSYEQGVISARANLDKIQSAYDRMNNLFKINAVTEEQLEVAKTNLEMAKADYAKALSLKKSSSSSYKGMVALARSEENQISLAEAQVEQCKADLQLAKSQFNYAVVRAPCNGIVSKRSVQAGQYVVAGQNFCALVENENLWITANFKETQLRFLEIGQRVQIKLDAYPDMTLSGKVGSFSGATGAKYSLLPPDNATGNYIKITQRVPVRITIDRIPKDQASLLYPGLSVNLTVYNN